VDGHCRFGSGLPTEGTSGQSALQLEALSTRPRRPYCAPCAIWPVRKSPTVSNSIRANRALIKGACHRPVRTRALALIQPRSSWPREAGVGVTLDSADYNRFLYWRGSRRANLIAVQLSRPAELDGRAPKRRLLHSESVGEIRGDQSELLVVSKRRWQDLSATLRGGLCSHLCLRT